LNGEVKQLAGYRGVDQEKSGEIQGFIDKPIHGQKPYDTRPSTVEYGLV
jgi:hypothetical protein